MHVALLRTVCHQLHTLHHYQGSFFVFNIFFFMNFFFTPWNYFFHIFFSSPNKCFFRQEFFSSSPLKLFFKLSWIISKYYFSVNFFFVCTSFSKIFIVPEKKKNENNFGQKKRIKPRLSNITVIDWQGGI